jgi:hypothetical protein
MNDTLSLIGHWCGRRVRIFQRDLPPDDTVSSLEMSVHFFVYTAIFNLVFIINGKLFMHLNLLYYSEMLVNTVLTSRMYHTSPGSCVTV